MLKTALNPPPRPAGAGCKGPWRARGSATCTTSRARPPTVHPAACPRRSATLCAVSAPMLSACAGGSCGHGAGAGRCRRRAARGALPAGLPAMNMSAARPRAARGARPAPHARLLPTAPNLTDGVMFIADPLVVGGGANARAHLDLSSSLDLIYQFFFA